MPSTSLPELIAKIAAVCISAHDMAVGNLFASNAFVAHAPASLLRSVDANQAVAGIGTIC